MSPWSQHLLQLDNKNRHLNKLALFAASAWNRIKLIGAQDICLHRPFIRTTYLFCFIWAAGFLLKLWNTSRHRRRRLALWHNDAKIKAKKKSKHAIGDDRVGRNEYIGKAWQMSRNGSMARNTILRWRWSIFFFFGCRPPKRNGRESP